jgi:hypothetical protein
MSSRNPADTGNLAWLVQAWRDANPDGRQLQLIITSWCAAATVEGIAVDSQLALLRSQGIGIGGGAAGINPDGGDCAYCKATAGGSHGGLCPRGTSGMAGEMGQPFSGGGGGGTAYLGGLGTPEPVVQIEALSDYVWVVLRWMSERPGIEGKFTASMVASGDLPTTDRGFVFARLVDAERAMLVARWRPDIGSPWYWQVTPYGLAALAERPVQP